MPVLRFRFEKLGKTAYLSHLDVMRTFQRAFVRADMPLKHSEGFNPHPKLSIAQPLQLGCESVCEALDAELLRLPVDKDPAAALSAVLPAGLRVTAAYAPEMKPGAVAYADWAVTFAGEEQAARAAAILGAGPLPVEKKTKRGVSTLDIAPHVEVLGREGEKLTLRLRAAEPTVNTGDVAKALCAQDPALRPLLSRRLALRNQNMAEFH